MSTSPRPRLAFGPAVPGWGSWEWVGLDMVRELRAIFNVEVFDQRAVPPCDVLCVIKHPLPEPLWRSIAASTRIIFAPVDVYGSAAKIDADALWLSRCDRIVIHCERLRRYFTCYSQVEYLDHHVNGLISVTPSMILGAPMSSV